MQEGSFMSDLNIFRHTITAQKCGREVKNVTQKIFVINLNFYADLQKKFPHLSSSQGKIFPLRSALFEFAIEFEL
jgi:hypothetical protein